LEKYPRISIITPSYNQAAYLEQTILSVLGQDYPNLEYMIIDGGSTDGSLEIIQKYADRLAWWVSEKDSGQAEAVNKGFQRASGDIIGWLNSDDLYLPGALVKAVAAFEAHPLAGLVFSDVESIDGAGERINIMRFGDWGLRDLMAFRIISEPGVFMRRSVLEKAGYLNLSYHFLLDHHLWLQMGLHAPIKYIPGACWAAARFHPTAKNVAQAAAFGAEAYRIVEWVETESKFQVHLQGIYHKVRAGAHRLNAFYLLDGGQPRAALRAYWKGLLQYPPAVLSDWHRILFALFSPLGLEKLRTAYLQSRARRYNKETDN
jgi:hypothetical protein